MLTATKPTAPKFAFKKKKKVKDDPQPLIKYDDPDLKVVIRLLPPNLTEEAFLRQIPFGNEKSPLEITGLSRFFYQTGSPSLKPFEEPSFSRAYFLFQNKEAANAFRTKMQHVVIEDSDSGDQVKCEMMKPIFGEVIETSQKPGLGKIEQEPLFKKFTALRAASTEVDLIKMIRAVHSEENRKRREKNKKKKAAAAVVNAEKDKTVQSETPTAPAINEPKPQPASDNKPGSSNEGKKDKKKPSKKSDKINDQKKKETIPPKKSASTNGPKPQAQPKKTTEGKKPGAEPSKPKSKENKPHKSKKAGPKHDNSGTNTAQRAATEEKKVTKATKAAKKSS
ncbi:hypothetical protein C7M61_003723 [Candidozyma pseudohaemuli]|uniref:UPF3 domain-containing protein n=1 Tax=Candidozyma pseudohaemuli TaxID=418784 RepID=A0A2P7YLN4_9ASCO|nr:hypothetical protein C7M61_003723 [[Candida] pseudohaemulonii]PSK36859.1 hypothetical protein C7M61_003723 [[Candida] pseudohaemulonii]